MLSVEGRFYCQPAALENVGVDHGGFDVFMPEEFLNGSYIVSALEEVGCEGVAESVGCDAFLDICKGRGLFDGSLQCGFVNVMTAQNAIFFICEEVRGGEDVLPYPGFIGIGEFFGEGKWHVD